MHEKATHLPVHHVSPEGGLLDNQATNIDGGAAVIRVIPICLLSDAEFSIIYEEKLIDPVIDQPDETKP